MLMRSPAFQFYPSDWLSSRAVRLMDAEQRGWYIQLLAESWESDTQATLPNDDALLRVLAGVNTCSTGVDERWEFVKAQFKKRGTVIYNPRLLDEVAKQEENRDKKRRAGEASAEARKAKREAIKNEHLNGGTRRKQNSTRVEKRSPSVGNTSPTESNPSSSTPSSISSSTSVVPFPNGNGVQGGQDFSLWKLALGKLMATGTEETAARSFLGKLAREYGKALISQCVTEMLASDPIEPKSYLVDLLKRRKAESGDVKLTDAERATKDAEVAGRMGYGN